jgi:hypothetical protein
MNDNQEKTPQQQADSMQIIIWTICLFGAYLLVYAMFKFLSFEWLIH